MRLAFFALLLPVPLGVPLACSSETANKNTNWLVSCQSSADCGGSGCLCGTCTVACASADSCAASGGVCAPDFAATTQCIGTESAGMCLAACGQESDCDDTRTCVAGACVTRESTSCPAHPGALACSGFDDSALPGWTPTVDSTGTLSVVTTPRLAGTGALAAGTSMVNGRSRFAYEFPAMTSGQIYLRAWIYVDPGTVLSDVHTIVVGDANTSDYGSKFVYTGGTLHVASSGVAVTGTVDAPLGQWYCLRLELGIGDQGTVRAYLNDTVFADATGVDTLPAAGVHNVTAGIDFAGQAEPAQVFIDELLLDTSPVSCWD
ncbi:MAG TPA: hypothetical protein VK745_17645 [Polyangiaceae bacterium]|nr:hypothetical protein [Polyangiaceae bacterium]